MSEQLLNLSERVDLIDVLGLAIKELEGLLLHLILLFGCVCVVDDATLVGQGVMHGQLLLQLLDLSLHLLQEKFWILLDVDHRLIRDLHHS